MNAMDKNEILTKGWDFAFDTEDWYPPIKAALKDVDFVQAFWRPEGKASHIIAELVVHLLYYKKRFLFRLNEREWDTHIDSNDETFETNAITTAEQWYGTVNDLYSVQNEIKTILNTLDEQGWQRQIPETAADRQVLSLIMHDAYHTGQIILIRKLYGSWPDVRDVS
jgi:hypothetical protein